MNSRIIIDCEMSMTMVYLIEDGILKEFRVEYNTAGRITGNIYKGRVENLLKGMQTAFVSIGRARNGFLYVGETMDHKSVFDHAGALPEYLDVKEGDYVMVQATKEEQGQKGSRLTQNVSLPGRYLVYLPTLDFVGVSNKITDESIREKLTKMLEKIKPAGGGFIARTICMEAKKSDILAEAKQLFNIYAKVKAAFDEAGDNVCLIHSDGDLIFRTVRDMMDGSVESVITNDPTVYNTLVNRLGEMDRRYPSKVKLYDGDIDMADNFGMLNEVDKLLDRKVALPSGGSIIIDRTEALTAIDVNTGSYVGGENHEDTVYKTNLEAAAEIARQIRLRNIGGIIIIDFIDMLSAEHKAAVTETLKKAALYDRSRVKVCEMSELGLTEITRKKSGREIGAVLSTACPYCEGGAGVPSAEYLAKKVKARIMRLFAQGDYTGALVSINADYVDRMTDGFFTPYCEGIWRDKRIYVIPGRLLHPGQISVTGTKSMLIDLPHGARLLY